MTPLQFTRSVRSLNRLRRIAQVLTQQGFGHIVARMNLSRFVPVWMLRKSKKRSFPGDGSTALGRRIARVCAELGPTFVKFAQLMTVHPDIVPKEVLDELRKLQDDVPPFGSTAAMQIIRDELGRSVDQCFTRIDEVPIASGSIGQVYRARTVGGVEVVVKVRRPGIEETIRTDMQLLRWLAESLNNFLPELRVYRPDMLVAELEQTLQRELDYIHEAAVTERMRKAFADDAYIQIPKVHWAYSGRRVLTFDALPGRNVASMLDSNADTREWKVPQCLAARRLVDCFLKQVFEVGLFHADPHPGNLLIDPPATIGLIDFGQVGTITDELMTQIVVMVFAAVNREVDIMVEALADLAALGPQTDRRQLARALQSLLDKYHGLPIQRIDPGMVMREFSETARLHDVMIPRDLLLLLKALEMVASTAARLDPDLNVIDPLAERLKKTLRERVSPSQLARGAMVWGWHLLNLTRHAPEQLREGLRRFSAGRWQLRIRHENLDRLNAELDRSSNRLSFSIVIAAIIVGSSIVVSADTSLAVFDIKVQTFGIIGYLLAGVLGLGLSWAIFRSGRLH